MVTIITIAIVTFVISAVIYAVYAVYASHRWSAVRMVISEPVGSGEFAYTTDMPNAYRNGKEYVVTLVKNLRPDLADDCRYTVDLVHDHEDWITIKFREKDIEESGMTPLQFLKKEVYQQQ